jgi:hypothetical protein
MFVRRIESDTKFASATAELVKKRLAYLAETKSDREYQPTELFDREEFGKYFHALDKCKQDYELHKNLDIAERDYVSIIDKYPNYPDAFIDFGNLAVAAKDYVKAAFYLLNAHKLCPFNFNLKFLLLQQYEKLNSLSKGNQPYPGANSNVASSDALAESENAENFRAWYHSKLRSQLLPLRFVNTGPLLRDDMTDSSDFTIASLANGAAIDCYWGMKAYKYKKFDLASYYYKKAIFKYEHDFISATKCATIFFQLGEKEKATKEITRLINIYNYSLSYFTRWCFSEGDSNDSLGLDDAIKCIVVSDKEEMDTLNEYQDALIRLFNSSPANQAKGMAPPFSIKTREELGARLKKIQKGINEDKTQANLDKYLFEINKILEANVLNTAMYSLRGDLHYRRGNTEAALLDYSICLWLGKNEDAPLLYKARCIFNFTIGDYNAANREYALCIQSLAVLNRKAEIPALENDIVNICYVLGNLHLRIGNFSIAEKVYASAILKVGNPKLYLQYAISLGLQERYDEALNALNDGIKMPHMPNVILVEMQKQIKLYKSRQKAAEKIKKYELKNKDIIDARIDITSIDSEKNSTPATANEKKKKIAAKATLSNTAQPKKRITSPGSTSHIHSILAEETKLSAEADEILRQHEEAAELQKKEALATQNLNRKQKKQNRKARLKSLRPTKTNGEENNSDSPESTSSDEITETTQEIQTSSPQPEIEEYKMELMPVEKQVFALFDACRKEHPDKTFKIYITGGWALARVRELHCNIPFPKESGDIDVVTDIPFDTLLKSCAGLKPIPQVKGLLKGIIGDIQLDVVYRENLRELNKDAMSRDFLPIYLDENAVIHDITGFVIQNMKDGVLKSARPAGEVFQRDPLTMLRAIYISSKLNLTLNDLKNQIRKHKHLLKPDFKNDLHHPYRYNHLLRKLFSQHLAAKNYDLLLELGLIDVLFPEISKYLQVEKDWMRAQMAITDKIKWPKPEIIYSNMLACAVMYEIKDILPAMLQEREQETVLFMGSRMALTVEGHATLKLYVEDKLIAHTSARIMRNSLLFQNRFSSIEAMQDMLMRSTIAWKCFQNVKNLQLEPTPVSPVAATSATAASFRL